MSPYVRWMLMPLLFSLVCVCIPFQTTLADESLRLQSERANEILALLKARCGECHGPIRPKSGLSLTTMSGVLRGGEEGSVVVPGNIEKSLLWNRIDSGKMPPDNPLPPNERKLIRTWIESGAPGLEDASTADVEHWAFRRLGTSDLPQVADESRVNTPVDRFILAKLGENRLSLSPEADRSTIIRRVSLDLTGLPPALDEIQRFVSDEGDKAYDRMVDRYLDSPHYGQRWGNHWLDAAGYADSNGYFSADTDRPLAWRYRDYVIRSFNADKPFDQLVREQLAGDELAELEGYHPAGDVTPRMIELLEATHFLRNSQDGTDSSDGNPDEVRTDKCKVLEGTIQIIGSSLLGLKLQCARCHAHKFEPIEHDEYYQLQAILYPALNIDNWIKPKDRTVYAASAAKLDAWEAETARLNEEVAELNNEFAKWVQEHRPPGVSLFEDTFVDSTHWSNTAPGDKSPAGMPAVDVGEAIKDDVLRIIESGSPGDRAISTKQTFDWTPNDKGDWIEASFDLVADRVAGSQPAARIGYFIALGDFDDGGETRGSILFDGDPAGGAAVHKDYPGKDSQSGGTLGTTRYEPDHRFGVRVTNAGDEEFLLEHLVDGVADEQSLKFTAADLPDGGFGFEYCCGRSFIVDNVVVESSDPSLAAPELKTYSVNLVAKLKDRDKAIKAVNSQRTEKPGQIAWVSDLSPTPPDVYRLERGDYKIRAEKVVPSGLAVLSEKNNPFDVKSAAAQLTRSTGHRLALARWLTEPDSKAASLLARVTVNRIWQHHFGTGIVATADNLGYSGSPPSHVELLDWLAKEFTSESPESPGWSMKRLHRLILRSAVYRQSSVPHEAGHTLDPSNRLLWRFPLRRLDAVAIRDGMLAASGELDRRSGGAYVPTKRLSASEVVVDESTVGARRRTVYLQQRRTQIPNILNVFDAPSIVFNCTRRDSTTVPLQSLNLLNSDFCRNRAKALSARVLREVGEATEARILRVFLLTLGRKATDDELVASRTFLDQQPDKYAEQSNTGQTNARGRAWIDFCQMLLASNAFLYVE